MFLNPNNLNSNCFNILALRNILEQVLKKSVLTFHCLNKFSDNLKSFANSRTFSLKFQKQNSRSQEHFFLEEGENNFGNKVPFLFKYFLDMIHFLLLQSNKQKFHKIFPILNSQFSQSTMISSKFCLYAYALPANKHDYCLPLTFCNF